MGIRDLGYKRYDGPRVSARKRYGVMTAQTLRLAWSSGLVKATVIVSLLPTLICAVVMWFKYKVYQAKQMLAAQGAPLGAVDDAANWVFYGIYWCQLWFAFAIGLLVAATAIADDVRTGASQFYFARAIGRSHYAVAKLVTAGLFVVFVSAIPGILLAGLRIGLSRTSEEAVAQLPLLLSTVGFALIVALVMTLPPLALSAFTRRAGYAQGAWAMLFFLPWVLGEGMALATDIDEIALVSLPTCLRLVGQQLFGMPPSYLVGWLLPSGVLLFAVGASGWAVFARLSRVERLL